MISIRKFVFNTFMVNTYLLYDETGAGLIVDAACYEAREQDELSAFIAGNGIRLERNINTHCHVDHVLGNNFVAETWGIRPEFHEKSLPFFDILHEVGSSFGYLVGKVPEPVRFLDDGETIRWGNSSLEVLYTPGHAEGSVCLYSPAQGFVITGDVLFRDTIGRTDLPSGNLDQLLAAIRDRLFTLPDKTVVLPGHGPETTIGYEKMNNPFVR